MTTEEVTMTGTSVSAEVEAADAGSEGNITSSDLLTVIESTLTDASITVTNSENTSGGTAVTQDDEYREIIKNLILALAGATEAAVKAAALAVPGIALAELTTEQRTVIDYDIGGEEILSGASFFKIPYPVLYIADANGNSSASLIASVESALVGVKAAGVKIVVLGASPVSFNWTASLTLDAGGPNYAVLASDLSMIEAEMENYINSLLDIGEGFNRATANTYILSVFGPSGTGDLTTFSTSVPSGNVSIDSDEKLIADTISIV